MGSIRVLIVDDSQAFRTLASELLERRGYLVAGEADCAASTMVLTETLELDAVLIDIGLPDLDGFELAALLRHYRPGLAVLLTSANYDDRFYADAEASGARGFVPKDQLAQVELDCFWPASRRCVS